MSKFSMHIFNRLLVRKSHLSILFLSFFLGLALFCTSPTTSLAAPIDQAIVDQLGQFLNSREFKFNGAPAQLKVEQTLLDASGENLILRNLTIVVNGQTDLKIGEITVVVTKELVLALTAHVVPSGELVLPKLICRDILAKGSEKEQAQIGEIAIIDAAMSGSLFGDLVAGKNVTPQIVVENTRVKSVTITNLAAKDKQGKDGFSWGQFGIYDFKDGALGKISLEQLVVNDDFQASVGQITFENMNMPAPEWQKVLADQKALEEHLAKDGFLTLGRALFFQPKPIFEKISVDKLNLTISGIPVQVSTVGIGVTNQSIMTLWVNGVSCAALEGLGIKLPFPLQADLSLGANYMLNKPCSRLNFTLNKLADLNITFSSNLKTMKLSDLAITLEDKGALAWGIFNVGVIDALEKELPKEAKDMTLKFGPDPINQKIVENIVAFIENPGKLKVLSRHGVELGLDDLELLLENPAAFVSVGVEPGVVPLRAQVKACSEQWMKQAK
ncbi:MAG: hypothetical protein IJT59_01580 [Desulfovibrionaceae bacterium]|nr:hypothetical protein [Desulfovibrionaceae bacterium]